MCVCMCVCVLRHGVFSAVCCAPSHLVLHCLCVSLLHRMACILFLLLAFHSQDFLRRRRLVAVPFRDLLFVVLPCLLFLFFLMVLFLSFSNLLSFLSGPSFCVPWFALVVAFGLLCLPLPAHMAFVCFGIFLCFFSCFCTMSAGSNCLVDLRDSSVRFRSGPCFSMVSVDCCSPWWLAAICCSLVICWL